MEDALREMEASGDRIADWASKHAVLILGVITAILVVAAGVGLWIQHGSSKRDAAADALALATTDYRQAMGADPAGGPIPEPANPELAERTRVEFAERFARVGRDYAGTAAGAVAWLQAGALQAELGQAEEARTSFEAARQAAGDSALAALAWTRIAALAEGEGDLETAAQAFENAADVAAYPLQAKALADAARCWAAADQPEKALGAFQRLETEFPDEIVAPEVEAMIAELRLDLRDTP
jgi:tetratricopeptide (TPR) repeat protein